MDIAQEVEAVKKELVELIIQHLRENKMEADKARELGSEFLAILPIENHQDLLNKLKQLGQKYPQAQQLYVQRLAETTNQQTEQALNTMRDAIKQGNIDHAITVAKTMSQGV